MNKRIIYSALLIITIMSGLCACKKDDATVYFATEAQQRAVADSVVNTEELKPAEDTVSGDGTQMEICVYICGQITNPGVYRMDPGSRICDLVDKAGGMLAEASPNYWNLAEELYDGQMIYIPTEEEIKSDLIPQQASSDTGNQTSAAASSGKIDINKATKEEFMTLTGIGESKAQSIVDYRTKNGSFSSIEDITKVSGIGEAMFNKIKDDITVN